MVGHKIFKLSHLFVILALVALVAGSVVVLEGCDWAEITDDDNVYGPAAHRNSFDDPRPGELVKQIMVEDSLHAERKAAYKKQMADIISDYHKRFHYKHFTGYFLTDFDHDGFPELWVKVGNYRENSRLELYYPMPDGTLKRSETQAEPGQYYVGDGYMMQVVGSGPGYISVNRITIRNGEMRVENVSDIDLYSDPNAKMPKFKEKEIRDTALSNLTPLLAALR